MKKIYITACFSLFMFCLSGAIKAQSIRWADTGREFARKIGDNLYEPVPAGVVSYKFENDKFWELLEGIPEESGRPKGYLSRREGKTYYFNRENKMVGYYALGTNRYYIVDDASGKEDEFALLYEGDLYMGFGEIRYKVDKSFPAEILGFFLFVH